MSLWSRIKNILHIGTPKTTVVSRETVEPRTRGEQSTEYIERLTQLHTEQQQIRAVEAVMFNRNKSIEDRKAALDKYVDITGWYRPDNAAEWSNEEWRRWEEIYESEPEVF